MSSLVSDFCEEREAVLLGIKNLERDNQILRDFAYFLANDDANAVAYMLCKYPWLQNVVKQEEERMAASESGER